MRTTLIFLTLLFMLAFTVIAVAGEPQGNIDLKLSGIEDRLADHEQKIMTLEQRSDQAETSNADLMSQTGYAPIGMVTFLFGAFCALWAQNTGRSAVGWFFLGLFFNVFTILALLAKNSEDNAQNKTSTA